MNVDIFNKDAILLAQCRNAKQLYLVASGGKGGCAMNGYKFGIIYFFNKNDKQNSEANKEIGNGL
jgi:hypothetical protein